MISQGYLSFQQSWLGLANSLRWHPRMMIQKKRLPPTGFLHESTSPNPSLFQSERMPGCLAGGHCCQQGVQRDMFDQVELEPNLHVYHELCLKSAMTLRSKTSKTSKTSSLWARKLDILEHPGTSSTCKARTPRRAAPILGVSLFHSENLCRLIVYDGFVSIQSNTELIYYCISCC